MKQRTLLEVIVGSPGDALAASAGGADRFELCVGLALGGLTPSLGLLAQVKRQVPEVPAMFMLRPREGGMDYSEAELSVMERDAELALSAGADGIVFGVLTSRGEVNVTACQRLLRIARQRLGVQTVFHRAFDVVADADAALEQIIDLGFTRVLTSGRAPRAIDGAEEIRRTRERAAGRIEILAAGGITPQNVASLIDATGVDQVHASLTRAATATSANANPQVRFPGQVHHETDEQAVRAVRQILDQRAKDH